MEPYSWHARLPLSEGDIRAIPPFGIPVHSPNAIEILQEEEHEVGLQNRPLRKRRRRQRRFSALLLLLGALSVWQVPQYLPLHIVLFGCSIILLLSSFLENSPLVGSGDKIAQPISKLATQKQVEKPVWDSASEARFSRNRSGLDTGGAETTASFLQALLDIPGVRVFHGMTPPGSKKNDAHHVVLSGNKVVIIEDKTWAPGSASWMSSGQVLLEATDGRISQVDMSIHEAVQFYQKLLTGEWVNCPLGDPNPPEVRGVVIVHSSSEGEEVWLDSSSREGVVMKTARDAVEMMGNWFVEGPVGVVDRRLLGVLLALR